MAAEPNDFGMGWSTDQVRDWRPPPKDVQLGYYEAVNSTTRDYLESLSPVDLERQIAFPPPLNTLSVAKALGILVWDNIAHGGQIAYLRGYYRGIGWFR